LSSLTPSGLTLKVLLMNELISDKSLPKGYEILQSVVFHDENQCEIRGIIIDSMEYTDHFLLTIQLHDEQCVYYGTLYKV